jgi:putative transposase
MGRPYSEDLRERVVSAVEGGMSRRQAAKHYDVAPSTVMDWIKLFRETGGVAPGKIGGYKPKAISGEHRIWLTERCRRQDFTLMGLVAELLEHRGLKVDYRSVWEFVHEENLSYKKKRSVQRAGSP